MAFFATYLPALLAKEGGFVNHPSDPGGATNKGITLKTYRLHYGAHKTVADLKQISNHEVFTIYKNEYWDKIWGDKVQNQSVAEIVFDHAVNAGPSVAIKMLQRLLNERLSNQLVVDGAMGPKTLAATNSPSIDQDQLHDDYADRRKRFYKQLVAKNPKLRVFLKGWLNRVNSFGKKKIIIGTGIALLLVGIGVLVVSKSTSDGEDQGKNN